MTVIVQQTFGGRTYAMVISGDVFACKGCPFQINRRCTIVRRPHERSLRRWCWPGYRWVELPHHDKGE